MSDKGNNMPRYMAQLLEELGWNQGTRIPLADTDNQDLETLLISRYVTLSVFIFLQFYIGLYYINLFCLYYL